MKFLITFLGMFLLKWIKFIQVNTCRIMITFSIRNGILWALVYCFLLWTWMVKMKNMNIVRQKCLKTSIFNFIPNFPHRLFIDSYYTFIETMSRWEIVIHWDLHNKYMKSCLQIKNIRWKKRAFIEIIYATSIEYLNRRMYLLLKKCLWNFQILIDTRFKPE